MSEIQAPFDEFRTHVVPEWIDFNGHLNAGYYAVIFDDAIMSFLTFLGLTDEHRERHDSTTFGLETHITYERELLLGDPVRVTAQLLDHDAKRVHGIQLMYHGDTGELAASSEFISIHIERSKRRSAPMAPELLDHVAAVAAAHAALPQPPQVGRVIGIGAGPPTSRSAG